MISRIAVFGTPAVVSDVVGTGEALGGLRCEVADAA
jgi:hypothetical protein